MVRLTYEAFFLHPLDQPCSTVVSDPELALKVRGRCLLALGNDLDGLAIKLCLCIVLAARLPVEQVAAVFRLLGDRLNIIRSTLLAPMFSNGSDLFVAHEWAMHSDYLLAAWHVEHVALAEQLLGALLAKNRSAVDLTRDLEAHSRGKVCLDHAGDHVHRRTLRCQIGRA